MVAFHVGQLSRYFSEGHLNERDIFNEDGTHFVIHLNTNRTLSKRCESEVKYAEVVSGDEKMTLLIDWEVGAMFEWRCHFWCFRMRKGPSPFVAFVNTSQG